MVFRTTTPREIEVYAVKEEPAALMKMVQTLLWPMKNLEDLLRHCARMGEDIAKKTI